MGTQYYLVDAPKREAISIGKAYWMPTSRTGYVVTAENVREVGARATREDDGVAPYALPLVLAWLEGREGVTLLTDTDSDGNPWENDDLEPIPGWIVWDAQTPCRMGWHPWRGDVKWRRGDEIIPQIPSDYNLGVLAADCATLRRNLRAWKLAGMGDVATIEVRLSRELNRERLVEGGCAARIMRIAGWIRQAGKPWQDTVQLARNLIQYESLPSPGWNTLVAEFEAQFTGVQ